MTEQVKRLPKDVKIFVEFNTGKILFEIPRIFFINYWDKICQIENSIKVKVARNPDNEEMVKRQVRSLQDMQFDAHERIFRAVQLDHDTGDILQLRYYLGVAIDYFMDELKVGSKQPSIIHVKRIYRARAEPKVTIIR